MTPVVTVYSLPNCVQGNATTRYLKKKNIPFQVEDARENYGKIESWGYSQAPVVQMVEHPDQHWSGFNPDRLKTLAI